MPISVAPLPLTYSTKQFRLASFLKLCSPIPYPPSLQFARSLRSRTRIHTRAYAAQTIGEHYLSDASAQRAFTSISTSINKNNRLLYIVSNCFPTPPSLCFHALLSLPSPKVAFFLFRAETKPVELPRCNGTQPCANHPSPSIIEVDFIDTTAPRSLGKHNNFPGLAYNIPSSSQAYVSSRSFSRLLARITNELLQERCAKRRDSRIHAFSRM